jgi:hypothetical protein
VAVTGHVADVRPSADSLIKSLCAVIFRCTEGVVRLAGATVAYLAALPASTSCRMLIRRCK